MRQQRLEKLNKLTEVGIQVYPASSKRTHMAADITADFSQLEDKVVTVAGRLMTWRDHSHLIFGDLSDQSGKIQLYIKDDYLQPTNIDQQNIGFAHLNLLDEGDFIQATGIVTKTQRGQISVQPQQIKLLTKTLRPLPNKWDGVKDPEVIFRRRYVDLAINPERREMFARKAKFWAANRKFLTDRDFIEVETPVLEHVTGGADARPFITHMNALDQDFYLRISTELYQKRLIGGGFEKVFTVGPNFRNEGLSDEHLPEYYQIEWYWAYADYEDNMRLVEEMFNYIAKEVYGTTVFTKNEHTFDLSQSWEKISYPDIIKERFDIDIFHDSEEKMWQVIKNNKVNLPGTANRQRLIDNIWKLIRKTIAGPAFLINEPKFMSPLAKSKPSNPNLTERFHIILAGSELGNGYSELNDPLDQLARFKEQQAAREQGDDEAQMLDIDFVEMLEYGMPPTSGYGHSERLFWFLENVTAREGTLFPQLKHKIDEVAKEIYGAEVYGWLASDNQENNNIEKVEQKTLEETHEQVAEASNLQEATSSPLEIAPGGTLPSREEAEKLLTTHVDSSALQLHCRLVAAAMAAYASELGEDEELWYQTGLLHDLDWQQKPDEHPNYAIKNWLANYPAELRLAIAAHAPERTHHQPDISLLAKYLFACDELSGFIHAASLMRPNGLQDMQAKSVLKKLKDKHFASNVSREDITHGAELINKPIADHIDFLIQVFKEIDIISTHGR